MDCEISKPLSQNPTKDQELLLRLGISACLLGHEVRYNGGHKRDDFLVHTLGSYVQWYSLCPEVEIGLGIPRESIRLTGSRDNPRLVAPQSGKDHTESMKNWAHGQLDEIETWRLHGYVLIPITLNPKELMLRNHV